MSVTGAGRRLVSSRRSAKVEALAHTLANEFSAAELIVLADAASLLERLAEHL
ncbi:MAG: hypothetical protein M3Y09_21020 [Actinomycetota bacterium]|nr:hypothetical protein [Actinomycetota bacterium]